MTRGSESGGNSVLPYEILVSLHAKSLLELVGDILGEVLHFGRVECGLQIQRLTSIINLGRHIFFYIHEYF